MMRGRSLLESVLHSFGCERASIVLFSLRQLLPNHGRLNRGLHLVKCLRVCLLALFHLHDVVAELRLHNLRIANLLSEDGVVEFWHHATALRKTQFRSEEHTSELQS